MKTRLRGRAPKRGTAHRSHDPRSARTGATGIQTTAGCTLALGHETTPIGEMHPALGAGWNRVGVPGWVPPDLTLDSNDLTRLSGFDAREAGGCERQQVFQAVRLRGGWASLHLVRGIPVRLPFLTDVPSNQLDHHPPSHHRRRAPARGVLPVRQFSCRDDVYDPVRQSTIYARERTSAGRE